MRFRIPIVALAALLLATPAFAQDLSIEKQPDGIRLNVDGVPVEQAVKALSDRYGFAVKFVQSDGQLLTGSRSGSVLEILNWVLNGNDRAIFMAKGSTDRIARVIVFGPSGAPPPPAPKQPTGQTEMTFPQDTPSSDNPPEQQQADPPPEPPPMDGGISDYGTDSSPPQ